MSFTSLNIGDLSAAARASIAPQPAPRRSVETAELGVSGTPIFGGFLRELGEYNSHLTGLSAVSTYEKMRRSDSQVAATLMAIKLPIRSAEWTVQAPDDATPIEQEATEFIQSCLMEENDFEAILRNALLMLDFGCGVHEDVYYIDGDRVRLKRAAPRLPITFYRWLCAEGTGDLVALEQYGYGGPQYKTVQIPVEKLSIFTFNQEGDNYTGIALLRPMYQHWFIKSNLYKIDAIAAEKNGLGIPHIIMGPDAKAEDRAEARKWLAKIAANESMGLLTPPGWSFALEGVKGVLRPIDHSIEHHNSQISMAALAAFLHMGQSSSKGGSRSLGETMSDFFYLGLQATANQIARVLTLTTITRLVRMNFGESIRVPQLTPQNILAIKIETLVTVLKDLAASAVNIIQPDDDLEAWMRSKIGAPVAKSPRPRPTGSAGTAPAGDGSDTPAANLSAAPTFRPRRELRGPERFMALSEISSKLDSYRDEIAAALRDARPRLQAEILHKLIASPLRSAHRVSVELDAKLVAAIENILEGASEYGLQSVTDERAAQLKGAAPANATQVRAAAKGREPLGVYADGVVSEFTNNLQQRAANVVLDEKRRAGSKSTGQTILDAGQLLDDQSDGWIDNVSAKGANEAFADGRGQGYEQYKDEIGSCYYSAILDLNTCEACSDADGEEGATPDDIPATPNPDCDGGDKCRCVQVFVFSDEAEAAA